MLGAALDGDSADANPAAAARMGCGVILDEIERFSRLTL
jgi:hypothetical protein